MEMLGRGAIRTPRTTYVPTAAPGAAYFLPMRLGVVSVVPDLPLWDAHHGGADPVPGRTGSEDHLHRSNLRVPDAAAAQALVLVSVFFRIPAGHASLAGAALRADHLFRRVPISAAVFDDLDVPSG